VILAVNNDGATIPAEDIPHVFDRFYRVDKARVRSEGGVGLGLAIAQEVAREHGGSIAVTSSEASGTTFTATLPRVM
jgi:signal transduction histidine kinase